MSESVKIYQTFLGHGVHYDSDLLIIVKEIKMQIEELTAAVNAATVQLTKAKDEITGKIAELQAALGTVEIPAEAVQALNDLTVIAQNLDDIVPDPAPTV